MEGTEICSQGRLITDGRGNTSEQGGHFRASLGESEDIVNEQQDILSFFISEVLSNSETSEADSSSGTRGFVHLSEDECASRFVVINADNFGSNHFVIEIVSFSGSLSDTGEDGVTTVMLSNVVNKFLNEHSLSDTGTSEETNLTTSSIGSEEIDDLNTSDENFCSSSLISERRGISVDRVVFSSLDGSSLINGFTNNVHDTSESTRSDWNGDRTSGVNNTLSSDETFSTVHGNSSDSGVSQVLSNLKDESVRSTLDFKCVQNLREFTFELNINDGTDNL